MRQSESWALWYSMNTSTLDSTEDFPFYVEQPSPVAMPELPNKDLLDLAQGAGTTLNSDSVDGINAVTATAAGPNKLVATDATGKLPTAIVPAMGTSTSVTAATSLTVSGLSAGVQYRLAFRFRQNTAAASYKLIFNADTGANYDWASHYDTSLADGAPARAAGDTSIDLIVGSSVQLANPIMGVLYFVTDPSDGTIVLLNGNVTFVNTAPSTIYAVIGAKYDGAASLSSLKITASAGTMTGTAVLSVVN